ncbi:MAG: hypothetical protein EA428_04470 [Spirochaetaceae bacterium]|nr:MAG: hypothetical protein EA428_04470 [Spirochaetaceae bacterium]
MHIFHLRGLAALPQKSLALISFFLCLSGVQLSAIGPGTLLDVELLGSYSPEAIQLENEMLFETAGVPDPRYEVDHYLLHFQSTDVDGSAARIRAQLFVPRFSDSAEAPVYVFAAGTTGVSEKCAPIKEDPVVNRWGSFRANMLAYAGEGFITLFPEYLGFGDPETPQRYFSKVAEAHVMLDAARAVTAFFEQHDTFARPSDALFLGGFSQGGHAAHSAADLQAQYAPEIEITGLVGYGQTNDVAMLMREMAYYSPYIIYTYAEIYGRERINPADYLLPKWLPSFEEDIHGLCVEEFQHHYPRDGRELFTKEFYNALHADIEGFRLARVFPEMAQALRENRAGFEGHGLPSLVLHGAQDIIVSTAAQERFVAALCRGGSEVQFKILPEARHRDVRPDGFQYSVSWMKHLAEGGTPPNDCTP